MSAIRGIRAAHGGVMFFLEAVIVVMHFVDTHAGSPLARATGTCDYCWQPLRWPFS